jgi:putative ABC transport system permease protein
MRKLLRRLRALILRDRLDRELDQELRFHVEMDAESLTRAGVDAREAHREAERALGGVLQVREVARDARGVRPVEDLLQDLRFGARALARKPSFTVAALLTFALGVGGGAAVLGAVNGILFSPFPYPESDRLVFAWERNLRQEASLEMEVAPANFLDWRERNRAFEGLAALEPFGFDYVAPEGPIYLPTWLVTEGFFDLIGLRPLHGRAFRPDDHRAGAPRVALLGHIMWRRQFGGDPRIVGQVLTFDGQPTEIVGVLPADFELGNESVWAPKVWEGWEATNRTSRFYTVIGRLREGVSLSAAQSDMDRVAGQLAGEHAGTNAGFGVGLVPFADQILGSARRALLVLLAAVGLVLVVAGANVANLQLARALDRGREFAVRTALGAGRGRLMRQLATESVVLAVVGSALGALLAIGGLELLSRMAPPDLPRVERLKVDGSVLLFAMGLGFLTALTAGLVPALSGSRDSPVRGLHGGRTHTASRAVRRIRTVLVTMQFAVALVLLVGVGLLLRSFVAVLSEDRGFRTDRVLVMATQTWSYFPAPAAKIEFVRRASELLSALPGIESVGMTSSIPLGETIGAEEGRFTVVGVPVDSSRAPEVHVSVATAGFFHTLDIPLRSGRLFQASDAPGSPPVVLINETLARRFFPGTNPLGRRMRLTFFGQTVEREVIGIVGDVRRHALSQSARPAVYVPHPQVPVGATGWVLRTAGDPEAVLDAARRTVWSLSASMPISLTTTMERLVGDAVRSRRFLLVFLTGFAVIALVLAATGIFGVISYSMAERTREIGVRMAFGADRGRVLAMVLKDAGRLAIIGIAIGVAGAVAATRVLRGMLHGVTPLDPATFGAVIGLLAAVALAATLLPARRAARLDPVDALRSE